MSSAGENEGHSLMSRSGSGGVGATLPAVTGSNEEPQLTLEHVSLTEAVDVDLGPPTGVRSDHRADAGGCRAARLDLPARVL